MSGPTLTTAAAGLRSALVVDIGWAETLVTAVYEYREVQCKRSVRAAKLLGQETMRLLVDTADPELPGANPREADDSIYRKTISFEECEDLTMRMVYCRPTDKKGLEGAMQGLSMSGEGSPAEKLMTIPLQSTDPPSTLLLPFSKLAEPCEKALFAEGSNDRTLDDEELPLHILVYRALLGLPVDVRSICMSRIIFTGGGSKIPGIKSRIMDEVEFLVRQHGWDPVHGKAAEAMKAKRLQRIRSRQSSDGATEVFHDADAQMSTTTSQSAAPTANAVDQVSEIDPVEQQVQREASKGRQPIIQGVLRAVESLGPWSGASLLSQLKISAVSIVEKEQWLQHGMAGTSRHGESSTNTSSNRHSMGPNALRAGERSAWTLGVWA
jgi:hypothetical protein